MSTNYFNTLITVAPDSPTSRSVMPNMSKTSVASQQFAWITESRYELTSDDVIFARVADRSNIPENDRASQQAAYFQTGRACLRTSPLVKQYGWGIHHDADGRIALIAVESDEYSALIADQSVKNVAAVRRTRG